MSSHPKRTHKLQDTQSLVEDMMKDAKLTPYQMKQIKAHMSEKKSLPKNIAIDKAQEFNNNINDINKRYGPAPTRSNMFGEKNYNVPKKKTVKQMIAENAFARDTFKPAPPSNYKDISISNLNRI